MGFCTQPAWGAEVRAWQGPGIKGGTDKIVKKNFKTKSFFVVV